MADTQRKNRRSSNKGGSIESSKEQFFENNKAQALVYPGPGQKLEKGGKVDKQHTKPATGGWRRWGKK